MVITLRNHITNNVIDESEVNRITSHYLEEVDTLTYTNEFAYAIAAVGQWLDCMSSEERDEVFRVLHLTYKD